MRTFLACTLFLAACGGAAHREPDEYTGCGKDETWRSFDDSESAATIVDDSQAPAITQPNVSATIAFSPKPVFQWNQDPTSAGTPPGDVPFMPGPDCNMCCPQFNMGALTTLHEPVISGDAYDLQFYIGGSDVHRVITTLQEWTAPDDVWASWRGATVTLKLYRIQLLGDQIKAGPWTQSQPIVLHIGS